MAKRYIKKPEQEDANVFWTTMSDMFLGLMMVFMTLFVFAMTGYSAMRAQAQLIQQEVAQELSQQFKQNHVPVDIDLMTGHIKISDVDLFKVGSYELSDNGKRILDKLFPIYVNTIFSKKDYSNRIISILIQGHSDSHRFRDVNTEEEQFIRNLDLSTKRAISVETYAFRTRYNKAYTKKMMKVMVAEGKSNSEPILKNGKEDFAKSRRVELKIVLKEPQIQDILLRDLQKKNK